jgi:hypothetical protein
MKESPRQEDTLNEDVNKDDLENQNIPCQKDSSELDIDADDLNGEFYHMLLVINTNA